MNKRSEKMLFCLAAACLLQACRADVLLDDDFDTTGLDGFVQVDKAGGTDFSLSSISVSGLSGQVGGEVGSASGWQPGAWLQAKAVYADATHDFSVAADVQFMSEGAYDDCVMVFGDLDGGNYYTVYMTEVLSNNEMYYYNGATRYSPATLSAYTESAFQPGSWYSIDCSWTAATETLSFKVTEPGSSSSFASFSVVLDGSSINRTSPADFLFGVQFGFGTLNDGARIDNVVITGEAFAVPPSPLERFGAVEVAPDGAWTWFNDERAIWHKGYLFCGYVKSNGEYGISRLNPANHVSDLMVISTPTSEEVDDHNNPSITVLPDDRLLTVYSKHDHGDRFFYRTSKVPLPRTDADWNSEQIQTLTNKNTYANTYRLRGESSVIYNFHRNINFNPSISISTNNGASWSDPVHFIKTGTGNTRPYPRYCSNHEDRIDLIYTDKHPVYGAENSVYHMFYRSGGFYRTDGSLIRLFNELPIEHDLGETGSTVYPYSADSWSAGEGPDDWIPMGNGWTWDICYGSNEFPVCVFQVQSDHVTEDTWKGDRIYYYYARWTGSRWQRRFIAQGGRPLYDTQRDYGGGMTIDPEDPRVIYISSNAENPFDLASISSVPLNDDERYEIYRGVTEDGGLTFNWTPVTKDSPRDNLRPIVPENHGYKRHLLWFYGNYTTYSSFNCQVFTIIDDGTVRLDDWLSAYGLTNMALTVDFDGDGLANLAEYALGGDPTNALDAPLAKLIDGSYRFACLPERVDAESIVFVSSNLVDGLTQEVVQVNQGGWTNLMPDRFDVESDGGSPEILSVPLNPDQNGSSLFIGLKVRSVNQ